MIKLNTTKTLDIILSNTNKALGKVLEDITPDDFKKLSEGKDLKSVLDSFMKDSSKSASSDKLLLNLLKNNPTLKELASSTQPLKDLSSSLKNENSMNELKTKIDTFLKDIKDITKNSLENKINNSGILLESNIKNLKTPQNELKNLLLDITKQLEPTKLDNIKTILNDIKNLLSSDTFKNISNTALLSNATLDEKSLTAMTQKVSQITEKLTQQLSSAFDKSISPNDPLFTKEFKEKLQNVVKLNTPENLQTHKEAKELFSNDMKATLLKAQDDISNSNIPNKTEILKQVDKLLLQIDYHQLISHLSNATSLYLPYSWDALEDGKLSIKNNKDGRFFTDIELTLKEYGTLKLRLGLFEKNQLNINITTESPQLKEQLKENLPELKKQLFSVGIQPKDIRFLDDKMSGYDTLNATLNVGFEAKA